MQAIRHDAGARELAREKDIAELRFDRRPNAKSGHERTWEGNLMCQFIGKEAPLLLIQINQPD
jgi:hypothetical protein